MPLLEGCVTYRYANGSLENGHLVINKNVFQDDKFVLVRNPQSKSPIYLRSNNEGKITALHLECTHKQCTVNPAGSTLACPCHGSRYDVEGNVIEGPARKHLFRYNVQVGNEQIYIQLPKEIKES